ncbi:hypothetical protein ACHAWF_014563 [Thalassiosira exigua]
MTSRVAWLLHSSCFSVLPLPLPPLLPLPSLLLLPRATLSAEIGQRNHEVIKFDSIRTGGVADPCGREALASLRCGGPNAAVPIDVRPSRPRDPRRRRPRVPNSRRFGVEDSGRRAARQADGGRFHGHVVRSLQKIAPIFKELSQEYGSKAQFIKVDVDDNPEAAQKYGVSAMPTFLFIKGGEVICGSELREAEGAHR